MISLYIVLLAARLTSLTRRGTVTKYPFPAAMPSPSEWEDRKSQILALIADNDLNTVLGKMKDQGFTAS